MAFYVTTSIPYVNGDPHLGHALELVQADVLARHRRLRGDPVRLQSGTDDNSLTNVQAAERAGTPIREFVTAHADRFADLAGALSLSYDDFIRTSSDPRHAPGVERLWRACAANDDLYRKHYTGLYCVNCEVYYTEGELDDGRCPEHGTVPSRISEENWFFRLSRYEERLRDLYESGRIVIEPAQRANEVKAFIRQGLQDFSVSRTSERAHGWGVPVPGEPEQVMYVWFDALGNYITSLGYGAGGDAPESPEFRQWWSAETRKVHVIGKGIVRFHAIYWPAMLLSAGVELPDRIYVHDYLTANGAKLSKSAGNVVDPAELVGSYGVDAVRWWLISQVPKVGDTDFTVERLVETANRDLAGGFGNLVQRVTSMVLKYRDGVVPDVVVEGRPDSGLAARIDAALDEFDLRRAAAVLVDAVGAANREIGETEPWKLAKAGRDADLDLALRSLTDTCRQIAHELRLFLPDLAVRLDERLTGDRLSRGGPLFPRLE